ncbi:MAG TPA: DUF4019 domain-containing protein [Vicinamibacteria bacterium]|nr:DUF4019 domain-containing protein [Vicinamibacteria bacterium]
MAWDWLRFVDEGRHAASWSAASSILRQGTEAAAWAAALRSVRAPLGRCLSRALRSQVAVEGPGDARHEPYVVARYDSVFERLGRKTETVTLAQDAEGCWRVAAYFVG